MVIGHSVGADSISARGTIWDIPPYGMVNESFFAYFLFKESRSKKVSQNNTTGPARFCRRETMLQPAISAVRL